MADAIISSLWPKHGFANEPQPKTCNECNYDRHECAGCGDWLYHGTNVCGKCAIEHGMVRRVARLGEVG